jgi:hypothetical protein
MTRSGSVVRGRDRPAADRKSLGVSMSLQIATLRLQGGEATWQATIAPDRDQAGGTVVE